MPEPPAAAATVEDLVRRSRGAELARLRTMLGTGTRGDGLRMVSLDAPAGAGASSIVAEVVAGWTDGPVVSLDARAGDGLSHVTDDHPGAQLAIELRAQAAAARLEQLAERGRVLVAIDHAWEDDAAASLYGALVDVLRDEHDVSVLLVRRVDRGELAADSWDEIVQELSRRRPTPAITAGALSDASINDLLEIRHPTRTGRERRRIVELSGGIPAIATMLARGTGSPATLRAWVQEAIDRLDEAARDALLTLSLVDDGLLEPSLAVPPQRLPFTSHRADGSWTVEPPAIRHAVRATATVARQRAVAAEAEERLASTTEPGAIADRARLLAVRGDHAASRAAWEQLAESHERAGELEQAAAARRHVIASSVRIDEQLDAVWRAARTVREQGLRSPSEDLLLRLRRLATRVGDDELIAWSIRELAFTRQDLRLLDDPVLKRSTAGWAVEARAAAAASAGDYDRVARLAGDAVDRARDTGDRVLELYARHRVLAAGVVVDPVGGNAIRAVDAAAELADVVDELWQLGARHAALLSAMSEGFVLRFTARFEDLVRRMQARAELARQAGRPNHAATLVAYEVEGLTELARLEDAAIVLARMEREADPAYDDGYAAAFLGLGSLLLAVEVGFAGGIRARHRALVESGTLHLHASLEGVYELVRIREALELGDLDDAARRVAAYEDADDDDLATAAADAARAVAVSGHERLREAAAALRARVPNRPGAPLVELALAEADACMSPDPVAALPPVIDAWRSRGCELRSLRLDVVCATLDPSTTEDALRALKSALRRAGMRGTEDRINALIRGRGGRAVARARPRRDAALSERERQVAELVVEGMTNAQVAERLGIRPATVARILANVYRRHELRGRASLVGFLDSQDQAVGSD